MWNVLKLSFRLMQCKAGRPWGMLLEGRQRESGRSKSHPVMGWIEYEIGIYSAWLRWKFMFIRALRSNRRRPEGVSLRENLTGIKPEFSSTERGIFEDGKANVVLQKCWNVLLKQASASVNFTISEIRMEKHKLETGMDRSQKTPDTYRKGC